MLSYKQNTATATIQYRFNQVASLLALFIVAIFICGLLLGAVKLSFHDLSNYFFNRNDYPINGDSDIHFIINLRLNRELMAICCGGMLAVGSALLQTLTRNSMIAPDLTGMTSIGCLLIIGFEINWFKSAIINEALGIVGAISGFLLCMALSKRSQINQQRQRLDMVLFGIIISFTATALMQLIILHAPQNIDDSLYFLTGSLYAINHDEMMIVLLMSLLLVPIALLFSQRLLAFLLDEETCHSMGVPSKRYWVIGFLLASLLIGSSMIGIGNLGFLGIVAPNLARLMVGNRPPYVVPLSCLLGSLIYLFADLIGRTIISPAEISAGLMTNMMTAPVFLYILFHFYRGQHEWH